MSRVEVAFPVGSRSANRLSRRRSSSVPGNRRSVCPGRVTQQEPGRAEQEGNGQAAEVPANDRERHSSRTDADQPTPGEPRPPHREPFGPDRIASSAPISMSRWMGRPSGRWVLTRVERASPFPFTIDVARFREVSDDALCRALGHAEQASEVADPDPPVVRDQQQRLAVAREERELWRSARVRGLG